MAQLRDNTEPCWRAQQGFTLLEVLVTVLVLSLGVLGLAGLHLATMRATQGAYFRSQAVALGTLIADAMRANRNAAVRGAYDTEFGDTDFNCASASTVAAADLCLWRQALAARLPSAAGKISVDGDNIATICVRWNEPRRPVDIASRGDACGALPAGTESFALQTVL